MDERYYKRVEWRRTTICRVVAHSREVDALVNRPIAVLVATCLALVEVATWAQPTAGARDASPSRLTALDPRWTLSFEGAPAAPAGFDREMAYVATKTGDLIAFSLDDGAARWRIGLPTQFTPATGDGLVFACAERTITALEQRSGRETWHLDLESPIGAPPYWDGGTLFVSTETGELIAIRGEDGRIVWRAPLASPIAATPTTSRDRLFTALRDGRLAAVGIAGGETIWTHALNEPISGMLALQEQLLVGTKANRLHSFSLDRGRARWSQKVGADVIGSPTADEQLIYFVAYDNVLRALARRSGNLRWTRSLPSRPSGGPIRVENVVLVSLAAKAMGAYLATTGAEAFTIPAAGEVTGAAFLRDNVRLTLPRVIAQTREGALQGFAPRVEPPPAALADLPGVKVGS